MVTNLAINAISCCICTHWSRPSSIVNYLGNRILQRGNQHQREAILHQEQGRGIYSTWIIFLPIPYFVDRMTPSLLSFFIIPPFLLYLLSCLLPHSVLALVLYSYPFHFFLLGIIIETYRKVCLCIIVAVPISSLNFYYHLSSSLLEFVSITEWMPPTS